MSKLPDSPHRIAEGARVRLRDLPTTPPKGSTKAWKKELADNVERIADRQDMLYADRSQAVLCVFQGIDGSGKDSTIKNVFSGTNPTGVRVVSFKAPTPDELDHDFLWRTHRELPARGTIGVFNRSWYEEVLIVRVHPEFLGKARLAGPHENPDIWDHRYESIRDHERHLVRNGTHVIKFFLNLSWEEQRRRFLERLEKPKKFWKFNPGDLAERARWDDYRKAWEVLLEETSRDHAPWYAIPADDKDYARAAVSGIVADLLDRLTLRWPELPATERSQLSAWKDALRSEEGPA